MNKPVEQLIDEILVMDCQHGSVKALEMLFLRWHKRLYRSAYHMTRDPEAAQDITQDTWLGIIKSLRKLNDPANFKAWAYRIVTNKSIDWIRKNRALRQINMEELARVPHKEAGDRGLKELLEKLDVRKKAVLSLYYFDQLSVSEISEALKIPQGTVRSQLHRARKDLKELWQQQLE